jgi:hypothetical protein
MFVMIAILIRAFVCVSDVFHFNQSNSCRILTYVSSVYIETVDICNDVLIFIL